MLKKVGQRSSIFFIQKYGGNGEWMTLPVDPEAYARALNERIRDEGKYPERD